MSSNRYVYGFRDAHPGAVTDVAYVVTAPLGNPKK